jgi:hypothetical protein
MDPCPKCAELAAENATLRKAIEIVEAGWTKGQPSSMNFVISEVRALLHDNGLVTKGAGK